MFLMISLLFSIMDILLFDLFAELAALSIYMTPHSPGFFPYPRPFSLFAHLTGQGKTSSGLYVASFLLRLNIFSQVLLPTCMTQRSAITKRQTNL